MGLKHGPIKPSWLNPLPTNIGVERCCYVTNIDFRLILFWRDFSNRLEKNLNLRGKIKWKYYTHIAPEIFSHFPICKEFWIINWEARTLLAKGASVAIWFPDNLWIWIRSITDPDKNEVISLVNIDVWVFLISLIINCFWYYSNQNWDTKHNALQSISLIWLL